MAPVYSQLASLYPDVSPEYRSSLDDMTPYTADLLTRMRELMQLHSGMPLQVRFLKADIDNQALQKTVADNNIASVVRLASSFSLPDLDTSFLYR